MKESELISHLNNLKDLKADAGWKASNRSVLLSQIYGPQYDEKQTTFNWPFVFTKEIPLLMLRSIPRPVVITVLIFVFIASAGMASIRASQGTKPGDSLYIAKIVSEQAQFALTFNEQEKAKLSMQFASNRAEELSKVLAEKNDGDKSAQVEDLVNNFRQEISDVKSRLAEITPAAVLTTDNDQSAKDVANNEKPTSTTSTNSNVASNENIHFYSANISKDNAGVQISQPNQKASTSSTAKPDDSSATTSNATSTAVGNQPANNSDSNDPQTILKQAEEMLDKNNYSETLNKLDEADKTINQLSAGQVNSQSDNATTTPQTETGSSTSN
jgi:hypothetical protein